MKPSRVMGILFVTGLPLWGCSEDELHSEDPRQVLQGDEAHWSYSGDEGPEFWGLLSEDYALCSNGKHQSPVNFPAQITPAPLPHLEFKYTSSLGTLRNNGHTIVVTLDEDSEVIVDSEAYQLVQLHFHSQSEHQVDGRHYPLELHLVHTSASGGLAVLGVFFEEGESNQSLSEVFQVMEDSSGAPVHLESELNLAALLPGNTTGWSYPGSLTTPPCTEGVHWNVLATPLTASASQIRAFSALHEGSNRPVVENSYIETKLESIRLE